jgi:hypothetical protein
VGGLEIVLSGLVTVKGEGMAVVRGKDVAHTLAARLLAMGELVPSCWK